MKKKEVKKTKIKPRSKATEQIIEFAKRLDIKLDWMIMLIKIWSIESEIKELRNKLTDEVDLNKLSWLEKRVVAMEKELEYERTFIFNRHK